MRFRIVKAEFNEDTACVDCYVSKYSKKPKLSIYTPYVEVCLPNYSFELERLIYENPLEYAEIVLDNDKCKNYLDLCVKERANCVDIEMLMYNC